METDGFRLICKNWFYVDVLFPFFLIVCSCVFSVMYFSSGKYSEYLLRCFQPPLGEKGRQGEEKSSNGVLTRESEREDKRWDKEAGGPSERVSKLSYDNGRSSFSPSNSRQSNEGRARSRSKSHDRERETSRSRFAEDEFSDRGRHHAVFVS